MDLKQKRVLVTGGSSGIGFAISEAMVARGARVVIVGRGEERLAEAATKLSATGNKVGFVVGDVTVNSDRSRILSEAVASLGGVDVLVNNAGAVRAGRLEKISEDDIRGMIEVDLVAPILFIREALPILRKSGDAVVVNVTSAAAMTGVPFYGTYAAAKAGLQGSAKRFAES